MKNGQARPGLLPSEAARELAVAKDTLRYWERQGILVPVRVGGDRGVRVFDHAEVMELKQRREQQKVVARS